MKSFRSRSILAGLAAVLAGIAGCSEVTISPPPDASSPVFEVEARNTAWFPHWAGFYVDAGGNVYAWDRSDQPDAALAETVLTPGQLAQKYSAKRRLVRSLTAAEVMRRYDLVAPAANAGLADQQHACADAGIQTFSAWRYEEGDGRFHRVLLHQRGDLATTRRSDAARALWHWLDELTREGPAVPGCDPYGD
jgi:hypothetical protein